MKKILSLILAMAMSLCGCTSINSSNANDIDLSSLIDTKEIEVMREEIEIEAPVENKRTERNEDIEQLVKLYYTLGNTYVDAAKLESARGKVSQAVLDEMQAKLNKFNAEGKTNRSIRKEELIILIGDIRTGGLENPEDIPISPPDPDEMTSEQAQAYMIEQDRLVVEAQKKYDAAESIITNDFYTVYIDNGGAYVYLDDGTKSPYIEDYRLNSAVNEYTEYELTIETSYYTDDIIVFNCIDNYMNKSIVRVELDTQGKVTNITNDWLDAAEVEERLGESIINFKKDFEILHSESTDKEYNIAKEEINNMFNSNLADQLFGEYNANTGYTTTINRISEGKKDGLLYIELAVQYESDQAKYSIMLEDVDRSGTYDVYTVISLEMGV